jgi:F-type H+-transporting ATPase subunit b
MRLRRLQRLRHIRLLALGGLGLALTLGFAAPAGAQEPPLGVDASVATPAAPAQEEPSEGEGDGGHEAPVDEVIHQAEEEGATHADAECIEILAEGGTIDDCREAPNPLLPEVNEIIWGAAGFIIVFFFLGKFGLPAVRSTMNERTERIRADLQAAEDQRNEAEGVLAEYRAQLNDARAEAGRIIEEARQAADQIRRDQEASLQAELAELRQRAVADIDAAKAQAMSDLRGDVAQLAIGAAETIVGRSLDTATQNQLVEDYINDLAARRS